MENMILQNKIKKIAIAGAALTGITLGYIVRQSCDLKIGDYRGTDIVYRFKYHKIPAEVVRTNMRCFPNLYDVRIGANSILRGEIWTDDNIKVECGRFGYKTKTLKQVMEE
jgi:hypothetical protein